MATTPKQQPETPVKRAGRGAAARRPRPGPRSWEAFQLRLADALSMLEDEQYLVLCHKTSPRFVQFASFGHGATWQRRHGQAANQADAMGLEGLGRAIRVEIAQYEQTPRTLAPEVYVTLEDAVSEARGGTSFAAVVRALAAQYGMTPGEVRSRYSRLRRVYEAAVREARAEEQRRAEWAARRVTET